MTEPRIGSLCSGYGGLEMGLQLAVGGTVAWHAEYDDAPAAILAHHWPGVPNLRDITAVDWADVEPVDWLTAGYPCQPFSLAGKRKGADDERHLWPYVAAAIGVLRPRRVLLENVAGHVTLGLGTVLGDLAEMGYDATWGVVRASDAGAPHRRERLFVVARDADGVAGAEAVGIGRRRGAVDPPGAVERAVGPDRVPVPDAAGEHERALAAGDRRGEPEDSPRDGGGPATDSGGAGLEGPRRLHAAPGEGEAAAHGGRDVPDASRHGRYERRAESARLLGRPDAALGGHALADPDSDGFQGVGRVDGRERDADGRGRPDVAWGDYEPAIRRWERVLGRPAPRPTEPGRHGKARLSPAFVEWLMGLPAGHVTAVPTLPRNAQLKALGNGVVPQQAALAVKLLLGQADLAVAP